MIYFSDDLPSIPRIKLTSGYPLERAYIQKSSPHLQKLRRSVKTTVPISSRQALPCTNPSRTTNLPTCCPHPQRCSQFLSQLDDQPAHWDATRRTCPRKSCLNISARNQWGGMCSPEIAITVSSIDNRTDALVR